jgi:hypothetical protein
VPWIKLDVGFFSHPKTLYLMSTDPTAATLHVAAMCWSLDKGQDGFVPEHALPLLHMQAHTSPESVDALVEAGLWEPDGIGYQIHDFLEWQESKADMDDRRRRERERKRRQRMSHGESQGDTAGTPPGLTLQEEMRPEESSSGEVDEAFELFWKQYPTRDGKKLDKGKALEQWRKLSVTDRRLAEIGVEHYADSGQRARDAFRWLRDRQFKDWQTPAVNEEKEDVVVFR